MLKNQLPLRKRKQTTIPGKIGDITGPVRIPSGNHKYIASPTILPKAAPILKIGIRLPVGTGNVEASTFKKN